TTAIKKAKPEKILTPQPSVKQLDIESEFAPLIKKTPTDKQWTLDLLMSLEWKRYEVLCKEWLIIHKQRAKLTSIGADGGIDITISDKHGNIIAIAQCKAFQQKVAVNLLREFYGVMASEKIRKGIYFTTSDFTQEAILFSNNKNIELINGKSLLRSIHALSAEQQQYLYQLATEGDYTTPTCPSCDTKMLKRNSEKGEFWGCRHYPKCKTILNVRKSA
ncbi:MAG: restriction endonuclease, partial [Methylococcaceae bacterium]